MKTEDFCHRGLNKEILTVDNHADGVYLYLKLEQKDPKRAKEVMRLLKVNKGNSSGVGIGCVDHKGNVHLDQFWRHYSLGNIRDCKFSDIWSNKSDALLSALRDRKTFLKGRCSVCRFLDICNGNFRVRAEAVSGDVWAPDPACYLTDEEIGLV